MKMMIDYPAVVPFLQTLQKSLSFDFVLETNVRQSVRLVDVRSSDFTGEGDTYRSLY
jgi:hypothetical protein